MKREDDPRAVATALLFPLRGLVELQFWVADVASELSSLHRLEARARELFSPKQGELKLLPTLFFESRHPVSFGVRAVALGQLGETSMAVSSGGPNDITAKSTIRLPIRSLITAGLTLEALYDLRDDLELLGVGQDPESDPRNVFREGPERDGLYLEKRSRALASLDVAITEGLRVVPSTSIVLGHVEDANGSGSSGLSEVFEATPLIENARTTRIFYSELSVRYATRRGWSGDGPGGQLEAYAGYGTGTAGEDVAYLGAGGRAALFVPIVRHSNTLSPKLVFDGMAPLRGEMPFTVLVRQPEFRGFDLRRDKLSLVASLDYRWIIMHYIAARLFVDAASVAPRFSEFAAFPPRFAAGFGFDVFNRRGDIGGFAFSGSADGPRVLVNVGGPAASGDRQNRN